MKLTNNRYFDPKIQVKGHKDHLHTKKSRGTKRNLLATVTMMYFSIFWTRYLDGSFEDGKCWTLNLIMQLVC